MSEQASAAPQADTPKIRPSKAGRWRAFVLVLVHVVAAIHIAHWMSTGSSMTPLEPSEAIQFSKHGVVNAGLIFFALTIVSTLVLGRWFCGWACHLVALQDLCRWMLLKVGIRPKPMRSRLLLLAPLVAAFVMFFLPLVMRFFAGDDLAPREVEITGGNFWETFPPWPVALFTFFVCGFVAVYFLGSKGFCTYACPYGALFGLADKLAVGRIRVTDACAGCGHCTAVCSSNVLVHAEVRDYGMVVDPGCMKCLDCVSVCPTNALYFGVGKPSLGAKPRREPQARRPAFGWGEELALGALFATLFFVVWKLYGAVPFLLALGLAGILAFLFLTLFRLAYRDSVSIGHKSLRSAGRLTAVGIGYVAVMLVVTASLAHGALIQFHSNRSADEVAELGAWRDQALDQSGFSLPLSDRALYDSALGHADFVHRFGWIPTAENESEMAALSLLGGDDDSFERLLLSAMTRYRANPGWHLDLARFYESRGRGDEAVASYRRFLDIAPNVTVYDYLGRLYAQRRDVDTALEIYAKAIATFPESTDLRFNRGIVFSMSGRSEEAMEAFATIIEMDPERLDARDNLAGLLCSEQRFAEGIAQYRAAVDRDPGNSQRLALMIQAYLATGDVAGARAELQERIQMRPDDPDIRKMLDALEQ